LVSRQRLDYWPGGRSGDLQARLALPLSCAIEGKRSKEASVEAVNAIAYATCYHSAWFWQEVQHVAKWRRSN
jgi:hypothetical protein